MIMGCDGEKHRIDAGAPIREKIDYIENELDEIYRIKNLISENCEADEFGEVRVVNDLLERFFALLKAMYSIGFDYAAGLAKEEGRER